jgi:hypothetical protein
MAGCAIRQPEPEPEPEPVPLPESCKEQQRLIIRMQQVLAEKEAEISSLRAHQQNQKKELKEITSQAVRAEVKLRRIATETDVASHLAEVEMAMEALQSTLGTESEVPLQMLAQQLLDAASDSFNQGEYSVAADLTVQAEQLIDMLMDNHSVSDIRAAPEAPFKIAIPLRIKVDSHLRRQPHTSAAVLGVLQKSTLVVARAYQGQWLRVQCEDGKSGWVLGELLEPR